MAYPQRQIIILASLFTYVKLQVISTISQRLPFPTVLLLFIKWIYSRVWLFSERVRLRNSLPTFHAIRKMDVFISYVWFLCVHRVSKRFSACTLTIPNGLLLLSYEQDDSLKINRWYSTFGCGSCFAMVSSVCIGFYFENFRRLLLILDCGFLFRMPNHWDQTQMLIICTHSDDCFSKYHRIISKANRTFFE